MTFTERARAVVEANTCRERWYAGDRWCAEHNDGWFPEGQSTCDHVHASDLYDAARDLLAIVEQVEALVAHPEIKEGNSNGWTYNIPVVRVALLREALTPKGDADE